MQTTAMMISRLRITTRETGRSKLIDMSAVIDSVVAVYMSFGFDIIAVTVVTIILSI